MIEKKGGFGPHLHHTRRLVSRSDDSMTVTQYLRSRLHAHIITTPVGDKRESLDSLRRTEWSPLFEKLMRNRLLVGRFRYGRMDDPAKGDYDMLSSIRDRLKAYERTGNLEHLVDVANLALVEFVHSRHANRHFDAGDDSPEGRRLRGDES
jgi:hypothetical protein